MGKRGVQLWQNVGMLSHRNYMEDFFGIVWDQFFNDLEYFLPVSITKMFISVTWDYQTDRKEGRSETENGDQKYSMIFQACL